MRQPDQRLGSHPAKRSADAGSIPLLARDSATNPVLREVYSAALQSQDVNEGAPQGAFLPACAEFSPDYNRGLMDVSHDRRRWERQISGCGQGVLKRLAALGDSDALLSLRDKRAPTGEPSGHFNQRLERRSKTSLDVRFPRECNENTTTAHKTVSIGQQSAKNRSKSSLGKIEESGTTLNQLSAALQSKQKEQRRRARRQVHHSPNAIESTTSPNTTPSRMSLLFADATSPSDMISRQRKQDLKIMKGKSEWSKDLDPHEGRSDLLGVVPEPSLAAMKRLREKYKDTTSETSKDIGEPSADTLLTKLMDESDAILGIASVFDRGVDAPISQSHEDDVRPHAPFAETNCKSNEFNGVPKLAHHIVNLNTAASSGIIPLPPAIQPNSKESHGILGVEKLHFSAYWATRSGRLWDGLIQYQQAVQAYPRHIPCWVNMILILLDAGENQLALDSCKSLLATMQSKIPVIVDPLTTLIHHSKPSVRWTEIVNTELPLLQTLSKHLQSEDTEFQGCAIFRWLKTSPVKLLAGMLCGPINFPEDSAVASLAHDIALVAAVTAVSFHRFNAAKFRKSTHSDTAFPNKKIPEKGITALGAIAKMVSKKRKRASSKLILQQARSAYTVAICGHLPTLWKSICFYGRGEICKCLGDFKQSALDFESMRSTGFNSALGGIQASMKDCANLSNQHAYVNTGSTTSINESMAMDLRDGKSIMTLTKTASSGRNQSPWEKLDKMMRGKLIVILKKSSMDRTKREVEQIVKLLDKADGFDQLRDSEKGVRAMALRAEFDSFKAGSILYKENTRCKSFWLVLKGSITISTIAADPLDRALGKRDEYVVSRQEIAGKASLDPKVLTWKETAVCDTQVDALRFSPSDYSNILQYVRQDQLPEFSRMLSTHKFLSHMSVDQLRILSGSMSILTFRPQQVVVKEGFPSPGILFPLNGSFAMHRKIRESKPKIILSGSQKHCSQIDGTRHSVSDSQRHDRITALNGLKLRWDARFNAIFSVLDTCIFETRNKQNDAAAMDFPGKDTTVPWVPFQVTAVQDSRGPCIGITAANKAIGWDAGVPRSTLTHPNLSPVTVICRSEARVLCLTSNHLVGMGKQGLHAFEHYVADTIFEMEEEFLKRNEWLQRRRGVAEDGSSANH